jgi:hypothetical protein
LIRFDDDNSHVAVTTQAIIQDVLCADQAARAIYNNVLPSYFVPAEPAMEPTQVICFYLIIPLSDTLGARWAGAGTRLVKKTKLQVHLFDNKDDVDPKDKW